MSLELKHLRCFVAVAEDLSFSAAARRLYVSQQALSRIIQQLEREVGVKLFDRTTRSVALTPAGEAMLASARRSTAAAEDAFHTAQQAARGELPRALRVDISSGGLQTGAVLLRYLREHHPDLAIHQVENGIPRGLIALRDGSLDILLGLATSPPAHIHAELFRREPVLVGLAANHPLAARSSVPVATLASIPLLLPSDQAAPEWVAFVRQFCAHAGITPRRWSGTTHGSVQAAEVVRSGYCAVPTVAWAQPPDGLVFRPLVQPAPVFPWSVMTAHKTIRPAEVDIFLRGARTVSATENWMPGAGLDSLLDGA
jgi:DNA-binding transcriptional LysR family regulator